MGYRVLRPDTAFSLDRHDRKQRRIEDPKHLAFVRTLPSVISGAYGTEACHIRMGDPRHRKPASPMARKPDDAWTLPLLPEEHREQHQGAESAFWRSHGIDDPCALALTIYAVSGHRDEAEKAIRAAMRKRRQAERRT